MPVPGEASLIEAIERRGAKVGVIGLGYVGLPQALRCSEAGFRVLGFDVDADKIAALAAGQSYIGHIPPGEIRRALAAGFEPTLDFGRAGEADVLVICVPTPLDKYREPDLSFVIGTTEALLPALRPGQLVALESTTYPGTTEEELRPRISSRGLEIGRDLFLVYSPEREDPGSRAFETRAIPKVCGGSTAACLRVGSAFYGSVFDQVVPVSDTRTAEMTKLLENVHRAVNIGLVNEMKIIADRMGIDIHEVIRAAATKPFGFVPYQPGPGLGGHCVPIDPFYLTWKAREFGLHTRFIELAGEINGSMPEWVIQKLVDALNERGRALSGCRVLVLGLAYKKNVDDVRESPAVMLLEILRRKGAEVAYSDPHIPAFPKMRDHHFDLTSVPLTPQTLGSFDVVLIATDHDGIDWDLVRAHAPLVIDTRGVYAGSAPNLVRA